ncbi:hypothetical protein M23134_05121 [Microscilla marina ATCC 23134]|uniref:Uncharacterized protein n=1 Tax=Microscilla marina ATCC 23134 TaxID=313606 RepID=A1ZD76_MICM2|nr:hypothetical protein M23134_05121 [Microscilla marina ATCC 23134]
MTLTDDYDQMFWQESYCHRASMGFIATIDTQLTHKGAVFFVSG